jgi:hypothetical protein
MTAEFSLVLESDCALGESPVWWAKAGVPVFLILPAAACIVSIPNPGATRLMRLPRTLGVSHRHAVAAMSPGRALESGCWAQAASSGARGLDGDCPESQELAEETRRRSRNPAVEGAPDNRWV